MTFFDDLLSAACWLWAFLKDHGVLLATAVMALIAFLTYKLSRRAELDRQPWVTIDAQMVDGIKYEGENGDNVVARFDLLFTNVGKTPALNVQVQKTAFVEETRRRPHIAIPGERPNSRSHVILPGETLSFHYLIKLPADKVREIADANDGRFKIGAVVHVFYQGQAKKTRRSTHRAFSMYRSDRQALTVDKLPLRSDELYLKTEGSKAVV